MRYLLEFEKFMNEDSVYFDESIAEQIKDLVRPDMTENDVIGLISDAVKVWAKGRYKERVNTVVSNVMNDEDFIPGVLGYLTNMGVKWKK